MNVRGPINVIRAFLPHFRANRGGRLIEQGGSKGNNFLKSVIFNRNPAIKDYDATIQRVERGVCGRD